MKENESEFIAKTFAGLEEALAAELISLGVEGVKEGNRMVKFTGTNQTMYMVNLQSRLSLRVLKHVFSFECPDEDSLYGNMYNFAWEDLMNADQTLAVDAVTVKSTLSHSKFAALRSKDAIVDRFRSKVNKRPSVDISNPDLRIHVHISEDVCNVSMDSSGYSLHKRGYSTERGEAPLNEVMAAGLVALSGWDKQSTFVDMMCGSGTILIEAAMMARNIAPGIFGPGFAFVRWRDFDSQLWNQLVEEAKAAEIGYLDFEICGCDISSQMVRAARENIFGARLGAKVRIENDDFRNFTPPAGPGTLISNPPYGERMQAENLYDLYKEAGDTFKHKYQGYTCWLLTSNIDAMKHVGLKVTRKIPVFNGPLECRLLRYEMYEGSKKTSAEQADKNQ